MCKSKCENCKRCPSRDWKLQAQYDDLKLELDTLCEDIKRYRQYEDACPNILLEMEENLITTYNYAIKIGLTYKLDEIL